MNRRDALKKLGAGGAIAAGGSMVLSSTNVAYASSGCLHNVPNGSLAGSVSSSGADPVTLTISNPVTCSCGALNVSYSWQNFTTLNVQSPIVRYDFSASGSTATVRGRKQNGGSHPLKSGDRFQVDVRIEWTCGGESVIKTFRIVVDFRTILSANEL